LVVPVRVGQTENDSVDRENTREAEQDQVQADASSGGEDAGEDAGEPQPGPSNGHPPEGPPEGVDASMAKLRVSQMRKPKLPPRAKIIQKKKKGSKKGNIFSKAT